MIERPAALVLVFVDVERIQHPPHTPHTRSREKSLKTRVRLSQARMSASIHRPITGVPWAMVVKKISRSHNQKSQSARARSRSPIATPQNRSGCQAKRRAASKCPGPSQGQIAIPRTRSLDQRHTKRRVCSHIDCAQPSNRSRRWPLRSRPQARAQQRGEGSSVWGTL